MPQIGECWDFETGEEFINKVRQQSYNFNTNSPDLTKWTEPQSSLWKKREKVWRNLCNKQEGLPRKIKQARDLYVVPGKIRFLIQGLLENANSIDDISQAASSLPEIHTNNPIYNLVESSNNLVKGFEHPLTSLEKETVIFRGLTRRGEVEGADYILNPKGRVTSFSWNPYWALYFASSASSKNQVAKWNTYCQLLCLTIPKNTKVLIGSEKEGEYILPPWSTFKIESDKLCHEGRLIIASLEGMLHSELAPL